MSGQRILCFSVFIATLFNVCTAAADSDVERAREALANELLDPEGTRFHEVRRGSDPNQICGLINSRNRFGGFDGRRRFIVNTATMGDTAFIDDGDVWFDRDWRASCLGQAEDVRREMKAEEDRIDAMLKTMIPLPDVIPLPETPKPNR